MTSDSVPGNCSRVVDFLVDYLEQKLPDAVQAELDVHLSACDSCERQLRTYRTTVSLLRGLSDRDLPVELRASALAFLDGRRPHLTHS